MNNHKNAWMPESPISGTANRVGSAFLAALVSIAVAKLLLVGGNEIVSLSNDSVNYVRQARDHLREIGSPMGYSYWLALTAKFGVPQRLVIEVFYLLGALAAAWQLAKVAGRAAGLATFALLAFLPTTFFLFDNALTDGFYVCLTLFGIAMSIFLLTEPDSGSPLFRRGLFLLALVLGWMLITRNEDALVAGWIAWLFACRFFLHDRQLPVRRRIVRMLGAAGIVAIGAFAIPTAVATYHWKTKNVFARTLPTLPSHMELLRNLASIDAGSAPVPRIPVTRAARDQAYGVSPALSRLRNIVEDPENMYQAASAGSGLPRGEVGAGWIWHVFNDAALRTLPEVNLEKLDVFYRTVNGELDQAFRNGVLKRRTIVHPLIGGSPGQVLASMPDRLGAMYRRAFESIPFYTDQGIEKELFDEICLRRAALLYTTGYHGLVQGWAFPGPGDIPISEAQIGVYESKKGLESASWFAAEPMERLDVVRSFSSADGNKPAVFGFRAHIPVTPGDRAVVKYRLSDGSYLDAPLEANGVGRIERNGGRQPFTQGIDASGEIKRDDMSDRRKRIQSLLIKAFSGPVYILFNALFAIAGAVIVFLACRRGSVASKGMDGVAFGVSALLLGIFLQRLSFFAVLDFGAWHVEERYLTSAIVLVVPILALLVTQAARMGKAWLAGRALN